MKALDHGVTIYYFVMSIASVCGEVHAFPQRHFVRKKIEKIIGDPFALGMKTYFSCFNNFL